MLESNFIRGFVLLIGFIGFGATTNNHGATKTPPAHAMDDNGGGGMLPPCLPSQGSCGIL
jgi:hypothetical protein